MNVGLWKSASKFHESKILADWWIASSTGGTSETYVLTFNTRDFVPLSTANQGIYAIEPKGNSMLKLYTQIK